jgi:hypothetical protein
MASAQSSGKGGGSDGPALEAASSRTSGDGDVTLQTPPRAQPTATTDARVTTHIGSRSHRPARRDGSILAHQAATAAERTNSVQTTALLPAPPKTRSRRVARWTVRWEAAHRRKVTPTARTTSAPMRSPSTTTPASWGPPPTAWWSPIGKGAAPAPRAFQKATARPPSAPRTAPARVILSISGCSSRTCCG